MTPGGRPATGQTPIRNVRIGDGLWNALKQRAEQQGITVSEALRRAIHHWLRAVERRHD